MSDRADVSKLVFSILSFLEDQKKAGQLTDEAVESLEVATQCLESAYNVFLHDPDMVAKYQVPKNLLDIFNTYVTTESDAEFSALSLHEATAEEKEEAERLKNKGNDFMKAEKFSDALECYNKAIKLDSKNAVYFCNRAAAYSRLQRHQSAIEDCHRALGIDPSYSKAYGRMGIAFTALGDHEGARECYRKALELDPDNQSYQNNLEIAEQKLREAATATGFGAGGGPGMGGFDLGNLLNNPALMNMATSLMSNPQMQQMMAGILSGAQAGGDQGTGDQQAPSGGESVNPYNLQTLLSAGQQLAQQVQQNNPELVAQLRQQMQSSGGRQNPPNDPNNPPGNPGNPGN